LERIEGNKLGTRPGDPRKRGSLPEHSGELRGRDRVPLRRWVASRRKRPDGQDQRWREPRQGLHRARHRRDV